VEAQTRAGIVGRYIPSLHWLRDYDRRLLSGDLIAGATAAAVVIPQAMGYATVAGLPVEVGLYTCIFPMLVYALLGTSRRLSFSTTSTIVALTGLAITAVGAGGDVEAAVGVASALTLMVGVSLILFRLIRLGWIVESLSEATAAGLKLGVGLTIIADQLPKLLGIPPADGGFFPDVRNGFAHLGEASGITVVLSLVTIAGLLVLRRVAPRVPGPLIALVLGIGLVAWTGATGRGLETIAPVPTGLPLPQLPPLDQFQALIPFALAIALMSYVETVTAARIARQSDDPPIDNNQEYVASGLAAIVGSFFQSAPPAGGFSQTQVNTNAGAQSQLSELVTVVLALAVALFLAPILSDLPEATLGAIVVVSVMGLIGLAEMRRFRAIDPIEWWVAALTAAAAVVFDLLVGVLVGVVMTLYFVLRALNHPVVVELRKPAGGNDFLPAREGDAPIPGLLVLRIEGGLYTQNVRGVQAEIYRLVQAQYPRPRVVLLDMLGTGYTSVTVIDVMAETNQQLEKQGTSIWVANLPTRAEEIARRLPKWNEWVDAGRVHPSVPTAVEAFEGEGPEAEARSELDAGRPD
jgi:high affinity sulfate transporter 1